MSHTFSAMLFGLVLGGLIGVAFMNAIFAPEEIVDVHCPPGMERFELSSPTGAYADIVFCAPVN